MRGSDLSLDWKDYELVDFGNYEKLERFGAYHLIRPEPKASCYKTLSEQEWRVLAHARFIGDESGEWEIYRDIEKRWQLRYKRELLDICLNLGLTSYKHVGLFPEQAPNWNFIFEQVVRIRETRGAPPKVLNLFAYTGAASLAAGCAGAEVTHLDSVKQVVTWAKENMECTKLNDIRWVVEDALKFVKRESKRGNLYSGVIMDPPAYGIGPKGERWKLETMVEELLFEVSKIVEKNSSFVVLNLYTKGFSPSDARCLMESAFSIGNRDELKFGTLILRDRFDKILPLSVYVQLSR